MPPELAAARTEEVGPAEPKREALAPQTVPLSSLAEVRVSNVDKKSEPGELSIRLCNYTDVYKNDYITDDLDFMPATANRAEIARFGLRAGDVIITKDSETPDDIGIPTLVDEAGSDLVCGYHLAMIRPSPDKVDPTFLAKQLAQPHVARYFGQQANGSTRYGLSIGAIERTLIWIPAIEQQRKAARVARLLDATILELAEAIEKLRAIRLGLIDDLISFGIDKDGELRPHQETRETILGRIPRDWKVASVESVADLITSGSRGWARYYSESGARFIRIGNLTREHINLRMHDMAYVAPPKGQEGSRTAVQSGDLLISITADLGIIGSVPIDFGEAYVNQHIALVRLNKNDVNPRWAAHYLSSRRSQALFQKLNDQGAKAGLNLPAVGRIEIPLPNRDEQDAIVERLDEVDVQITRLRAERDKTIALRTGLSADLFEVGAVAIIKIADRLNT